MDFIIGNTPLNQIKDDTNSLFYKEEGANPYGSCKDRAAVYVLNHLYEHKIISRETVIFESSSGNMGIGIAAVCAHYGNHFICVVDPHISKQNEEILRDYEVELIKVDKADENNSYLKTRLKEVKRLERLYNNSYWFNQYGNPLVRKAYESIGEEIYRDLPGVEYVFVAVSSGGTISGISTKLRQLNPHIKIIAVDVLGSKTFGGDSSHKRYLSGIGSSIQADNMKYAIERQLIDDAIFLDEMDGIKGCRELLAHSGIFAGASSGCVYGAIKIYIEKNRLKGKTIVGVFPDRGERYTNTVYSDAWCEKTFGPMELCR